jgi:plastocyanin
MQRFRMWGLTAAAAAIMACSGYNAAAPTGPSGNNNPGTQSGSTLDVQVQDGSFQPAADTVAVNSTVTWTWAAGPHNVTFQDGVASDNQSSGTYQRTFASAGTYAYRCTLHSTSFTSGMTGTIVVR